MKTLFSFVFLLAALFQTGPSWAQETSKSIEQGKPLKIRYRSKNFKGPVKSVLIRDKITGDSALLAIPLVNEKEGLYEATFILPFDYSTENTTAETQGPQLEVFPVKTTQESLAKSIDLSKQNLITLQTRRQEQQRLNYELAEAQKRELLENQARALSEADRNKRQIKAVQISEEALSLYNAKKYPEASRKFQEAIALDPENNRYYYQYGVSLFQEKDYQKSLVALSMADEGDFSTLEKSYFIGMNHFRMNESEKAIKYFTEVRDGDDSSLSPTSSFYAGVLQYNSAEYTEAKVSFNYVLDKSQDPKMDQTAEGYLEKIDAIEQFNANFNNKWIYNINAGLMYDSNVLNVAAANAPTDMAGFRGLIGASLEHRLIYDYFKEWSLLASFSDMYSTNTSLSPSESLQNADPLVYSLSSPFRWKTTMFERPYTLQITPGFESLMMNADGTGDRETTNNSLYLKIDNTFAHKADWVGTYGIEYRDDQSLVSGAPDDDQTAKKIILGTTQIFIADPKTMTSYIFDSNIALNDAAGSNQKYQKLSLGFTYTQAWYWKSQVAYRADLSNSTYPNHAESRQDTGYGLSASASKSLTEKISTAISLGWSQNSSNIDSFTYDKFSISNVYTYSGAF